jgi:hypothetical protein
MFLCVPLALSDSAATPSWHSSQQKREDLRDYAEIL